MRLRTSARWLVVILALGLMLVSLRHGPSAPVSVRAQQPDVYLATASSAATDTRTYETGSPVDPAPLVNTATPLASITADNSPRTEAHAAYSEPPGAAQAATNLENVPIPYATAAESLCVACARPVVHDAEGSATQTLDGSRIDVQGGNAHTEAGLAAATAIATNAEQRVGPLDQLAQLYDSAVADIYGALDKPAAPGLPPPVPPVTVPSPPPALTSPPPCVSPPTGGIPSLCPGSAPASGSVVDTAANDARTTITVDSTGTVVDTTSAINGSRLLGGLISIASIRTEVVARGDGKPGDSKVDASNDVEGVCVLGDCSYTITANGVCKRAEAAVSEACANDPINQALRGDGLNVCRLNTATSGGRTEVVTGNAAGVLVEFHAYIVSGTRHPDSHYYDGYAGDCSSGAPVPRAHYNGDSSFTILGESSAQLFTRLLPACTICGQQAIVAPGQTSSEPNGGTTTSSISVGGGDAVQSGGHGTPGVALGTPTLTSSGGRSGDDRPLELAALAMLEIVLLGNISTIARLRRRLAR